MALEHLKKKKKEQVWCYKTQHVDTMLWQYGVALEQISNRGMLKVVPDIDNEKVLNELVEERFIHYADLFKVSPSFKIQLKYENGLYRLNKITL